MAGARHGGMLETIQTQASYVALDGAYIRGAGVILAFLKTFLQRQRFATLRTGTIEIVCALEPVVLLSVAGWLHATGVGVADPGLVEVAAAVAGAVLDLVGWALLAWSFLSWRSLFAGHG